MRPPGEEKTLLDSLIALFIGTTVLLLLGAVAFGIYISKNDAQFLHLQKGSSSPSKTLSLKEK